jgi:tetratricopeptide (TPR) repeat protein
MSDNACMGAVAETLDRVAALYDQSRFVAAYNSGKPLGPLQSWPDDGRLLAARLAWQIGLPRLGAAIVYREYRRHARHPHLLFCYVLTLAEHRGPLFALEAFDEQRGILSQDPNIWPAALGFLAWLHALFRDYSSAHALIRDSLALRPEDSWLYVMSACIHKQEDRLNAALEDARQAHALDPASPSVLQCLADVLLLHNLDDEAAAVLEAGLERCESVDLAFQLAAVENERGRFDDADHTLDRAAALAPLVDRSLALRFAMWRCDVQCRLGNRAAALRSAEQAAKVPFYASLARRLTAGTPDPRRVILPVGFIRQHHMTCAPATLASISRFWARPAEHLDIVEAICYDGTPQHSQRRWASEEGWIAREFTVDWNAARALLDAGFPFTLARTFPGAAHLVAVIGYDALRGTLLIRDPGQRTCAEVDAEIFCAAQAPHGPRGMVLAPESKAHALAAISLPDSELYDLHHRVQDALVHHRRDEAEAAVAAMDALAPDHRLAISVRMSLAFYDRDEEMSLAMVERMLGKYPDDPDLQLTKARSLGVIAPRERQVEYLRERADASGAAPLVQLRLVSALIHDARELPAAERRLRRILRQLRVDGEALHTLAVLAWMRGDRENALRYYRFAATADEFNEVYARDYFDAARALRHEEDALRLLQSRVSRLGTRSGQPVMTLVVCLEELERSGEARCALGAALASRPEDGELLLFGAEALGRRAQPAEAAEMLNRARGRTREARWQRAAGNLALMRGDLDEAAVHWRAALADEPLDLDAQGSLAQILNAREGREAALRHLRALVERFPHHHGVHILYVSWLDQAPLDEREAAVRQLLAVNPVDAWARRELALVLAREKRFDEALAELAAAERYDPEAVANFCVMGDLMTRRGELAPAREAFRNAIRRSVDAEYALRGLLSACPSAEERTEEIRFIEGELVRQVTYGDGLIGLQELAQDTLEPEALLTRLREAHSARPDLWHAWVALVRQLSQMDLLDEAAALADQTITKFPLLPRAHAERANVLRLRGDRAGERDALEEAVRLAPGWPIAARALAENLEAEGLYEKSREVLARGLRHCAADPFLHGYLADVEWRLGRREEAVASLRAALELEPDYAWAWARLGEWSAELGQTGPEGLAVELVNRRPGEARCWLARSRVAADPAARMEAVERAIALEPFNIRARTLQLDYLIEQGDLPRIRAALAHTPWGDEAPAELRLREAECLAGAGHFHEAVAVVERILEHEPRFRQGWQRLVQWRHDLADDHGSLAAAQRLHSLAPNAPVALGFLAEALRRVEPQAEVRPQLRRALALWPGYGYAAFTLFDENVRLNDLDEAARVLAILRCHHPGPYTAAREVTLACKRGDRVSAEDAWRAICRLSQIEQWLIEHAAKEYSAAGWDVRFQAAFNEALLRADSNPALGDCWIKWRMDGVRDPEDPELARVFANSVMGRSAAQTYLRILGKRGHPWEVLHAINCHGASFASDPGTMGEAACALARVNQWTEIVRWFGDWRSRDDFPAWALANLSAAFDALGDERTGEEVARKALAAPKDHSTDGHSVRAAFGAASAGACAQAKELLAAVDEDNLSPYERFVIRTARALLIAADAGTGDLEARYRQARSSLARAVVFAPDYRNNRFLKRAFSRAAWRVARMHSQTVLGAALEWIDLLWHS